MHAAIYCRISKDTTGQGAGVGRQETDCRAYCEQRGWNITDTYIDNSRSAYDRRKTRPAYRQMMSAARAGHIDTIVVWHLDRLYRHPTELEEIIELVEARTVTVATVTGGDYDLTTTDGRAMARVVVAFARKEVEDKSRRHLRMHQQLAQEGRWQGGGTRPYGYSCSTITGDNCHIDGCQHDRGLSLIPTEADNIRHAAKLVLNGASLRSICAAWNRDGTTTVTGKKWTTHVLRRILTAPHTAGLRAHKGAIITNGQWPAIIPPADSARLAVILHDPARRNNELGGTRRYLLAGLIVCERCEARMVARPRANKKRGYVCATGPGFAGCGHTYTLAEPVEAEVAKQLFARVDQARVAADVDRARASVDADDAHAEISALEAKRHELATMWADPDSGLDTGEWVAARQAIERRLAAARRRVVRDITAEQRARWAGRGDELAVWWDAETTMLDQRRAVLAAWADSVSIGPSRLPRGSTGFDPDRVTVWWRRA